MGRARQGQSAVTADRFADLLGARRGNGRPDDRETLRSAALFMDNRSAVCLAKIRGEAGCETVEFTEQSTEKFWLSCKASALVAPDSRFGRDGIGLSSPSPAVFLDAETVREIVAWVRGELAWTTSLRS